MHKNTKAVTMALIISTTALLALAPSGQAKADFELKPICLNGDWADVCLNVVKTQRNVIVPDTSRLVYHCTDPIGTGDICVPTVPSIQDALTARQNVNSVTATYSFQVHGQTIVYDICMIVFGNPYICGFTEITLADADNDGALDSILVNDVAVPFS